MSTPNLGELRPSLAVGLKLASLAVHADELLSAGGSVEFDGAAIRGLLADPDVAAYLALLEPHALLPKRRSA